MRPTPASLNSPQDTVRPERPKEGKSRHVFTCAHRKFLPFSLLLCPVRWAGGGQLSMWFPANPNPTQPDRQRLERWSSG